MILLGQDPLPPRRRAGRRVRRWRGPRASWPERQLSGETHEDGLDGHRLIAIGRKWWNAHHVAARIDTENAHDGRRFVDSVGRRRRRFVVRVVVDWFRWKVPGAGLAIRTSRWRSARATGRRPGQWPSYDRPPSF